MKRLSVLFVLGLAAASIVLAGCSQAAPVSTPAPAKATAAPAVPAATAAPAAPAATTAPTQPAAAKVNWPEKGKPVTIIVPWVAGDANDVWARLIGNFLEKEIGTSVQIVNKPGAGSQTGLTELVRSKPDGYTYGFTSNMTTVLMYLDPDKQAIFDRKSFQPVVVTGAEALGIYVKGESPFKTPKDLVDAAKASPEKITIADNGVLTPTHVVTLELQKTAGVKFASVHVNGAAEQIPAVLGGHVEAGTASAGSLTSQLKTQSVRMLAIADSQPSPFLPGVSTFDTAGYKNVNVLLSRGIIAPAGVPADILTAMEAALKRVYDSAEFKQKANEANLALRWMNTADFMKHWDELETSVKPVIADAKAEIKK